MGVTLENFLDSDKPIECFIAQSDFRIKIDNKKVPDWFDVGDTLSINTDKNKKINSIVIKREENEDLEHFEFQFNKKSTCCTKKISDHIWFLSKSGLCHEHLPDESYNLEVIIQCNCGEESSSGKEKVMFFFYKEPQEGEACTHASNGGGSANGGGWAK